jgi:disulfide bond formation protein DsbB
MSTPFNSLSGGESRVSRAINTLALAGVCGVLAMAFFWQLIYNDLPCPLCLLQRVGFVLVGIGLLMNVRFGPCALHYGIIVLSAVGGAFAAGRQVLLHIPPGDTGYGLPFLGMHFYTWAFVLFAALIVYAGIMLVIDRRCVDQPHSRPVSSFAYGVMWLFFILVAANVVSTLLECGFGACPDDPTSYLWLS